MTATIERPEVSAPAPQIPQAPSRRPDYAATGAEGRLGRHVGDKIPELLLFTAYRESTKAAWRKRVKIEMTVDYPPLPIPEMEASTYTYEALRYATGNLADQPVVVRGLFKDSTAVQKWGTPDYLPSSRIGNTPLPVIKDAVLGSDQADRETLLFKDAFRQVLDEHVSKYIFFPVQSRFEDSVVDKAALKQLQLDVNALVKEDLGLDRIFPGFAGPDHKKFAGSQMIIGWGQKSPEKTTGTGWHCAISNNFFVQAQGRKRWYFFPPALSRYMFPIRNGINSFMTSLKPEEVRDVVKHLPVRYCDMEAGDMLYNPYWQWHTVVNYEGLTIGVPIRERCLRTARKANRLYTNAVIVNHLARRLLGWDIGGYGGQ